VLQAPFLHKLKDTRQISEATFNKIARGNAEKLLKLD